MPDAPDDPRRPDGPPQQPPPGWGPPPPGWGLPTTPPPPPGTPPGPPQGWGPPPGWAPRSGPPQPPPGTPAGWGQPPAPAPSPWARPASPADGGYPPPRRSDAADPDGPGPGRGAGAPRPSTAGPTLIVTGRRRDPAAYPVRVSYDRTTGIGRGWGLPVVGVALRALLLVPHAIVLALVAVAVALILPFTWLPVLLLGRQADPVVRIVGGFWRWNLRCDAWLRLLCSGYPPFSLSGEDEHPVRVEIDRRVPIARFWGIPIVGIGIRAILVLPHLVALLVFGTIALVLACVAWVPVLVAGRQAAAIHALVGGHLRWAMRVLTWLFLLHDRYPPFRLGTDEDLVAAG
ncbi:MAG: DUF4389 domain-containing protein [Chloroflexota bacterium]